MQAELKDITIGARGRGGRIPANLARVWSGERPRPDERMRRGGGEEEEGMSGAAAAPVSGSPKK